MSTASLEYAVFRDCRSRVVARRPVRHGSSRHPFRDYSTVVASASVDALGEGRRADGVVARHAILRLEAPPRGRALPRGGAPRPPATPPRFSSSTDSPIGTCRRRRQIPPLVRAGYRVLAPNLRGYAKSGKPEGVDAYAPAPVVDDLAALLDARDVDVLRAVVGHDWGAAVSFAFADRHASRTRTLVVLNGVHPTAFLDRVFSDPAQFLKSYYVGFFQIPAAPEVRLSARANHAILRLIFRVDPATPMPRDEEDALVAACAEPGAMRAALNYYRAAGPAKNLWSDVGPCQRARAEAVGIAGSISPTGVAEPPKSLGDARRAAWCATRTPRTGYTGTNRKPSRTRSSRSSRRMRSAKYGPFVNNNPPAGRYEAMTTGFEVVTLRLRPRAVTRSARVRRRRGRAGAGRGASTTDTFSHTTSVVPVPPRPPSLPARTTARSP